MQNQNFTKNDHLEREASAGEQEVEVHRETKCRASKNHKASSTEKTFKKNPNRIQEELTSSETQKKPHLEALSTIFRDSFKIHDTLQALEKTGLSHAFSDLNQCLYRSNQLRGGSPEGNSNDNIGAEYSELIGKFQQYKKAVLNDSKLERELNLFIKVYTHHQYNDKTPIELVFDLKKNFLNCESTETPHVLLLTGQAGVGKSFFCKYLQREILIDWNESQTADTDENNWFPIYVDLSNLKNPKSEAISESLARELFLTHSEILLLQTAERNNFHLPRLIFIFDGYDSANDIQTLTSLNTIKDLKTNNFCALNKIEGEFWKNAKFVITCREEHIKRIQRRDLLLAPLVQDPDEISIVPGSFLERKLEPFSDEQITCYLKRYCCFEKIGIIQEQEKESIFSGLSDSKQWEKIENAESLIDKCKLRGIARIPLMLWIISQTLNKSATKDIGQFHVMNPSQTSRFLIKLFVDEVIRSTAERKLGATENLEEHKGNKNEEAMSHLIQKITLQLQSLVLRLRGDTHDSLISENDIDETLLLKLYPLVEWDQKLSMIRFRCSLFSDLFFAKIIGEEVSKIDPLSINQTKEVSNKLLLNQHMLSDQIILFLRDAIVDKKLTTDRFLNLIHLFRKTNDDDEEKLQASKEFHFSVGAANAMTILNSAGYDFSKHDLSNISVPGANLNSGIFEGTKFQNANLENVDFTEAWLKDAHFMQSNLKNIEFGEISSLKLKRGQITNISYSESGKYLAVGLSNEVVIFENLGLQKFCLKETRRLSDDFLTWRKHPCNMNQEQLITVDRDDLLTPRKQSREERKYEKKEDPSDQEQNENISFYIWDANSGRSIEKLDIPIGNRKFLSFNLSTREVIAFDGKRVQKYDVASNLWTDFLGEGWKDPRSCTVSGRNMNMLLVGDSEMGIFICDSRTGKALQKQRQAMVNFKVSFDGKQIVSGTNGGDIQISDCVRGYAIKFQISRIDLNPWSKSMNSYSLNQDGKQLLIKTKDSLSLQDAADTKQILTIPLETECQDQNYSFNPSCNQLAFLAEKGTVSFVDPSLPADSITQTSVRGMNNKGLNLQETIMSDCVGLRDSQIEVIKEKGEYGQFNEKTIKSLFPNNSIDSDNVKVVSSIAEKLCPIHAKIIGSNLQWINLQRLDLSRNNISDKGGEAIGKNRFWINLEELILLNAKIGDRTAIAIAHNQAWKNLKMLQLGSNLISDKGAETVGKNEIWVNLDILDLHQNKIGDPGALIISTNICWEKLTSLNLSSNKICDKDTINLLCSNNTWKNLNRLMLHDNVVHLEEQERFKLIDGIPSKSLELFSLPEATFGQKLLRILEHSAPQEIKELSLNEDECNGMIAVVIQRNISCINLKKLSLSKNEIGDEVGIKIGNNIAWVNLEELDLSNNELGPETGIAIGNNKSWSKLKTLDLNSNNIDVSGTSQIAKNTTWINLQSLELGSNMIGDEGTTQLSQNTTWANLQTLNLSDNMIGVIGVAGLCKNTTWIELRVLNLFGNQIHSEGVSELSRNQTWKKLENLILSANAIGDKGAIELSKNTGWTNLKALFLRNNSINSEGVAELSKNVTWKNLETLELSDNKLGADGAKELSKNLA